MLSSSIEKPDVEASSFMEVTEREAGASSDDTEEDDNHRKYSIIWKMKQLMFIWFKSDKTTLNKLQNE